MCSIFSCSVHPAYSEHLAGSQRGGHHIRIHHPWSIEDRCIEDGTHLLQLVMVPILHTDRQVDADIGDCIQHDLVCLEAIQQKPGNKGHCVWEENGCHGTVEM